MDSTETAVHTVATVEALLHKSQETDATRVVKAKGMEKRPEWTRPLVEFRSSAHE